MRKFKKVALWVLGGLGAIFLAGIITIVLMANTQANKEQVDKCKALVSQAGPEDQLVIEQVTKRSFGGKTGWEISLTKGNTTRSCFFEDGDHSWDPPTLE